MSISISANPVSCINLAMVQNNFFPISYIKLDSTESYENLTLIVNWKNGLTPTQKFYVKNIEPNRTYEIKQMFFEFDIFNLATLTSVITDTLCITVVDSLNNLLAEATAKIEVLPANVVTGLEQQVQLLATYVTPQDMEVKNLISKIYCYHQAKYPKLSNIVTNALFNLKNILMGDKLIADEKNGQNTSNSQVATKEDLPDATSAENSNLAAIRAKIKAKNVENIAKTNLLTKDISFDMEIIKNLKDHKRRYGFLAYLSLNYKYLLLEVQSIIEYLKSLNFTLEPLPKDPLDNTLIIRQPSEVISSKSANLLELTILFNSLLEGIGIHSGIILTSKGVYASIWLKDKTAQDILVDDIKFLEDLVNKDELIIITPKDFVEDNNDSNKTSSTNSLFIDTTDLENLLTSNPVTLSLANITLAKELLAKTPYLYHDKSLALINDIEAGFIIYIDIAASKSRLLSLPSIIIKNKLKNDYEDISLIKTPAKAELTKKGVIINQTTVKYTANTSNTVIDKSAVGAISNKLLLRFMSLNNVGTYAHVEVKDEEAIIENDEVFLIYAQDDTLDKNVVSTDPFFLPNISTMQELLNLNFEINGEDCDLITKRISNLKTEAQEQADERTKKAKQSNLGGGDVVAAGTNEGEDEDTKKYEDINPINIKLWGKELLDLTPNNRALNLDSSFKKLYLSFTDSLFDGSNTKAGTVSFTTSPTKSSNKYLAPLISYNDIFALLDNKEVSIDLSANDNALSTIREILSENAQTELESAVSSLTLAIGMVSFKYNPIASDTYKAPLAFLDIEANLKEDTNNITTLFLKKRGITFIPNYSLIVMLLAHTPDNEEWSEFFLKVASYLYGKADVYFGKDGKLTTKELFIKYQNLVANAFISLGSSYENKALISNFETQRFKIYQEFVFDPNRLCLNYLVKNLATDTGYKQILNLNGQSSFLVRMKEIIDLYLANKDKHKDDDPKWWIKLLQQSVKTEDPTTFILKNYRAYNKVILGIEAQNASTPREEKADSFSTHNKEIMLVEVPDCLNTLVGPRLFFRATLNKANLKLFAALRDDVHKLLGDEFLTPRNIKDILEELVGLDKDAARFIAEVASANYSASEVVKNIIQAIEYADYAATPQLIHKELNDIPLYGKTCKDFIPYKVILLEKADAYEIDSVRFGLGDNSFILKSPPGSGKTEALLNIIGNYLNQKRTVLYVSEKKASLSKITNALKNHGLADFVLSIYDEYSFEKIKAMIKERVAKIFAEDLEKYPPKIEEEEDVSPFFNDVVHSEIAVRNAELRKALNKLADFFERYAVLMHSDNEIGISFYEAINGILQKHEELKTNPLAASIFAHEFSLGIEDLIDVTQATVDNGKYLVKRLFKKLKDDNIDLVHHPLRLIETSAVDESLLDGGFNYANPEFKALCESLTQSQKEAAQLLSLKPDALLNIDTLKRVNTFIEDIHYLRLLDPGLLECLITGISVNSIEDLIVTSTSISFISEKLGPHAPDLYDLDLDQIEKKWEADEKRFFLFKAIGHSRTLKLFDKILDIREDINEQNFKKYLALAQKFKEKYGEMLDIGACLHQKAPKFFRTLLDNPNHAKDVLKDHKKFLEAIYKLLNLPLEMLEEFKAQEEDGRDSQNATAAAQSTATAFSSSAFNITTINNGDNNHSFNNNTDNNTKVKEQKVKFSKADKNAYFQNLEKLIQDNRYIKDLDNMDVLSFIKTFACRLNEEGIAYSDKLIDLKNSYAPVLKSFGATYDELYKILKFDKEEIPHEALAFYSEVKNWQDHNYLLRDYLVLSSILNNLREFHFNDFVKNIKKGHITEENAEEVLYLSVYQSALNYYLNNYRILKEGDADIFTSRIEEFGNLMSEFLTLSKEELMANLNYNRHSNVRNRLCQTLHQELDTDIPLEKLMSEHTGALKLFFPVIVVNKEQALQLLSVQNSMFDTVIFEESGQTADYEVASILARGRKAIINGDEQTLPPAKKLTADCCEVFGRNRVRSILDLAYELGLPQCTLLRHYRSASETLFAFSNRYFYQSKLASFSSTNSVSKIELIETTEEYGKELNVNHHEALAIASFMQDYLRKSDGKSIGIVAFSTKQKDLITQTLKETIYQDEECIKALNSLREPFIVKSIEDIGGDVRDVLLLSFGFAKLTETNYSMNYGLISSERGKNYLNTALSRARDEMYVFSGLKPEDMRIFDDKNEGVMALSNFLNYAKYGVRALGYTKELANRKDYVVNKIANELTKKGYTFSRNYGLSPFKIDIAIKNPDNPDRYTTAIFFDGVNYVKGAANGYDANIAAVTELTNRGWQVIRVWCSEYLKDPKGTLEKLFSKL